MSSTVLLRHLHEARIAHYRHSCANDATDNDVVQLYLWNSELAAALSEVLGFVEVALRHTIDMQLRAWSVEQCGSDLWIDHLDALPTLQRSFATSRRNLYKAADESRKDRRSDHPRRGEEINHDDLLAHVMFGTWGKLLPEKFNPRKRHADGTYVQDERNLQARRELWKCCLHKAFPEVAMDPRGFGTGNKVRDLRKLRNRVSHMDSLLYVNVGSMHDQVLMPLLNSIDNELRDWALARSRVKKILAERPSMR
ncbi:Abi family protein [Rhodococcus qingshengii]|uniref:Abi family protein n=1 Tax=Rhodococcus qingshengii TaxID=334542 RepID=UPI001BEAA75D|nr:Abi family protein [Rhodococcus qingshengii]MBT2270623.1 Abi family protein [Rhodococcus qingshengii]